MSNQQREELRVVIDDVRQCLCENCLEVVETWINKNYIPKQQLRDLLKNASGGGDWRRKLNQLLDE